MEEGRMVEVEGIPGQYRPEYFLCNHLGDVRVVFSDTDEDGTPETLQENHYYPFGLTMGSLNYVNNTENKLKYNGKELDDENNLRWYDYGFRRYDPQLGRWHVMDALSEKYINLSPYAYVANNPFRFIDQLGLYIDDPFGGEGGAEPTGNFFGKNTYEPSYYVTDIEEGLQFRGDPIEIKYEVRNGKVYKVTYNLFTDREISAVCMGEAKTEKEKNEEDDKEDKDEQKEDDQSEGGDGLDGVVTIGITATVAGGVVGGSFEFGVAYDGVNYSLYFTLEQCYRSGFICRRYSQLSCTSWR